MTWRKHVRASLGWICRGLNCDWGRTAVIRMLEPLKLWLNARIATCDEALTRFERGAVVTRGGRIEWIGASDALPKHLQDASISRVDLRNRWITPGLIDCHTHLIFAGQRANEWNRLLQGESYEEIARAGGGILSTVHATRQASESELFEVSAGRLQSLLAEGVTTLEIKSGYGLTFESERKMLRVARSLAQHYPITIHTTFLAAHATPPEFAGRADEYIDVVANEWLPRLYDEGLVDMVDVFCERIAFNVAQSERLLRSAHRLNIPIRAHAEQLAKTGATQLATRYGARSCDHLEYATGDDARAMAAAGTVGVLLPIAFLHTGATTLPPIAAFRTNHVAMAVASDINPGTAPGTSLQLAGALAIRLFHLTPAEALVGMTRHAARACDYEETGCLKAGLAADFALWDVDSPDEIFYWLGRNSCVGVVRGGRVVRGSVG